MSNTQSLPVHEGFFQKVLDAFVSIFKKAKTIEQKIAEFADKLVNGVKTFQANPTVQFFESGIVKIAESVDPALIPLISGIELALPKILSVIQTGTDEINKPEQEQLNDFVAYLQKIKGINGTVYAGLLATLNAAIQKYITDNNGIIATDAQVITAGQAAHATN